MKIQRIDDLQLIRCPDCNDAKKMKESCRTCKGTGDVIDPWRNREPILLSSRRDQQLVGERHG